MIFILKVITKKILNILFNYSPFVLFKMILWPLYYILKRISWLRLPDAGKGMGLRHVRSDYYSEFGTLKGKMSGCPVLVEPDKAFGSRISINFRDDRKFKIEFGLSRPHSRPDRGMQDFKTASWRFNLAFRTCRGSKRVMDEMGSDPGIPDSIIDFYLRWIFDLESFSLSDDGLWCEFSYGLPLSAYLPAGKMKKAVQEMLQLADALDALQE